MTWAPDYVTVQEFRDNKKITDAADDVEIALAITAASRAIDRATKRQFGLTSSEARSYYAKYDRASLSWYVSIDDLPDDSPTVTVDGAASTGWTLGPLNAAQKGEPYTTLTFGRASTVFPSNLDVVTVTAAWGWLDIPSTIKAATLLQADRFHARRQSPWGVAGSPAGGGGELRLLERVDPDVRVMVSKYRRWWGAR